MKLRNKKTGEIIECTMLTIDDNGYPTEYEKFDKGDSLAELNEEWEDYKEPKDYWIIDTILHEIRSLPYKNNEEDKRYEQWLEELGLKFETREDAELAVEKLKAWKRLKDKGFKFEGWDNTDHSTIHNFSLFVAIEDLENINKDLDLLFGGEDDKK